MIKVENLFKAFGAKLAVNDISFTVERGEVLGFLGPNGAGKSTTMRMVTGFIPPTSGRISVGGFDMVEDPIRAKRLIGYLPENAPAYTDMTVHGFLSFTAELRGLSGVARDKAVDRVIETCFLEGVRHQSVDTLSKGYRHRTCFAQSIIHDPDVLIMDEPTATIEAPSDVWKSIALGQSNAMTAFMTGKIKATHALSGGDLAPIGACVLGKLDELRFPAAQRDTTLTHTFEF